MRVTAQAREMAKKDVIVDLAMEALATFAAAEAEALQPRTFDAGPAILAALACARSRDASGDETANAALSVWLDWFHRAPNPVGLFGGLAGLFVGARSASSFCPSLIPLAGQLRDALANEALVRQWRSTAVEWQDYDLISGPSGVILALMTDPMCSPAFILPAARHLALLCDREDLERLRVGGYREDELRRWNVGRINTGLAHGVGGVVAALRAACEISHAVYDELEAPLRRACRWLIGESYIDNRGLQTWPIAGLEGAARPPGAGRRQAWCYGAPGLAWTLWEAGRVLDDRAVCAFTEEAMRSFCAAFDEQLYIDDGPADDALSICHGVAGTLAIADAFALHAGHPDAARLADRLEAYLLARTDEILRLAHTNMTLLTGASGILALLLVRCGSQRDWLSQIGAR